jgi:hypothetical protein
MSAVLTILVVVLTACSRPLASGEPSANGPVAHASPLVASPSAVADPRPAPSSPPAPMPTVVPSASDGDPGLDEPDTEEIEELYEIDCSGDTPCRVDYLPDGGSDDAPGWPVVVSGPCRGDVEMADGRAYFACDVTGGMFVHAFTADGNEASDWPVALPGSVASVYENDFTIGCGEEQSSLRIGDDGTIYVAVSEDQVARIYALRMDGPALQGWPRPFPGDPPGNDGIGGNGCRGFTLAPNGDIVAWGYEGVEEDISLIARRTEFTVYGRDGRTRPGWPRGSTGAASAPLVSGDGSITYVSATGKVWRHRPDGTIAAGWPYDSGGVTQLPWLTPDDRVVLFLPESDSSSWAVSLTPQGGIADGWPVSLGGAVETVCLFGDTPCVGSVPPAFGSDDTLYVSLANGTIIAIDKAGRVVPGWPVRAGSHAHVTSLAVDASGRVVADVIVCPDFCGEGDPPRSTNVYRPDGTLLKKIDR